jgi:hypothetical protein
MTWEKDSDPKSSSLRASAPPREISRLQFRPRLRVAPSQTSYCFAAAGGGIGVV